MTSSDVYRHRPVMLIEAIEGLDVQPGKWYLDGTFGRGGHTKEILVRGGKVIAMDHDQEAIQWGEQAYQHEIKKGDVLLIRDNFAKMLDHAEVRSAVLNGALFDFGVSSPQLDDPNRGFSFQQEAPLDMRMDDRLGVKASDLVNALGKKELFYLLTTYAQESRARVIVEAILRARERKPIETTAELARVVEGAVGRQAHGHLHPATKTFLALRMVVNDELGSIEQALPIVFDTLAQNGKLVTISFHEGEDRIVKHAMVRWESEGKGKQQTKKPLQSSAEELRANPRSRSAKLRVFIKGRN